LDIPLACMNVTRLFLLTSSFPLFGMLYQTDLKTRFYYACVSICEEELSVL